MKLVFDEENSKYNAKSKTDDDLVKGHLVLTAFPMNEFLNNPLSIAADMLHKAVTRLCPSVDGGVVIYDNAVSRP